MTFTDYSGIDREGAPLSELQVGLARADALSATTAASASQRRRGGIGLAVAVVLLAVGLPGGMASAHSVVSGASARAASKAPLRAIFYSAAPVRSHAAAKRALSRRAVARQLAALRWARADVAIMPWSRPGFAADRALRAVITGGAKHRRHVRVAVLIDRLRRSEVVQINALASRWASARGYLHIGSRPAVFVALADRAQRDCAGARRWRAAAAGFWLAQGTFAGYERCGSAADAWFSDHPRASGARAPGTFLIRPAFRPKHAKRSQLRHSLRAWRRAVARMNASGARLQLIDSLNGWRNRTAISPSSAWRSRSRFGRYLDALHAHSPRAAHRADLPSVGALAPTGVTSHGGSLVVTLSADSARSRWWVEFGRTAAYGRTTAPVALPVARAPRAATANLGVLAAGTTYHARVVAASPAGVVASPDAVLTTPPDATTPPNAVAVIAPPATPGTGHGTSKPVFAVYYLWWTNQHWHDLLGGSYPYTQAPNPSPATLDATGCNPVSLFSGNNLTDVSQTNGTQNFAYAQDAAGVIESDVRQAAAHGVTGFSINWKGSGAVAQSPETNGFNLRLQYVFDAVHKVNSEGIPFKLQLNYQASSTVLPTTYITNDLNYYAARYGNDSAQDHTYSARPEIIWTGSWKYSDADVTTISRVLRSQVYLIGDENVTSWNANAAQNFDGDSYYWSSQNPYTNAASFSQLQQLAASVRSTKNPDGSNKTWLAPFTPGFNSQLRFGGNTCVPRNNGATMHKVFDGNKPTNPDGWLFISWNEIAEGTYITPLTRYGDFYLSTIANIIQTNQ
jgi:hypothetical protein